jgi:hypothetical protein
LPSSLDGLFEWNQHDVTCLNFGESPLYFCGPGLFDLAFAAKACQKVIGEFSPLFRWQLQGFCFEGSK